MTSTMPPKKKTGMTAEQLRTLMNECGFETQADLAAALDVHRITIVRWLNGKSKITEATALLIKDRLKNRKRG